jgi:hypothetical protein
MERNEIEFALGVLGGRETVFHYFKDRYAVMLLGYLTSENAWALRAIKLSPFSGLLKKELLRELLSQLPDGKLENSGLAGVWCKVPLAYVLTVGSWPKQIERRKFTGWYAGYHQTSRPGYNLVLQLNFSHEHERTYRELMPTSRVCPFEYQAHPVATERRTLAWSRIDFDLDTGEALIEEVQSDWIRLAYRLATQVESLEMDDEGRVRLRRTRVVSGVDLPARGRAVERYLRRGLEKHRELWSEAMLAATIEFVVNTLGLRRIYYHTHESGAMLKSIPWTRPPRSLYTQLPKRFCFVETVEPPEFLRRSSNRRLQKTLERGPRWHLLDLEPGGLNDKRA